MQHEWDKCEIQSVFVVGHEGRNLNGWLEQREQDNITRL